MLACPLFVSSKSFISSSYYACSLSWVGKAPGAALTPAPAPAPTLAPTTAPHTCPCTCPHNCPHTCPPHLPSHLPCTCPRTSPAPAPAAAPHLPPHLPDTCPHTCPHTCPRTCPHTCLCTCPHISPDTCLHTCRCHTAQPCRPLPLGLFRAAPLHRGDPSWFGASDPTAEPETQMGLRLAAPHSTRRGCTPTRCHLAGTLRMSRIGVKIHPRPAAFVFPTLGCHHLPVPPSPCQPGRCPSPLVLQEV